MAAVRALEEKENQEGDGCRDNCKKRMNQNFSELRRPFTAKDAKESRRESKSPG
jgi:hypothetical protein